ncbi:MAG: 30S ribosomal protein S6 [Pseudomonadota bacterium]|nr:30S ribosomal protein S6 [Pseudomonadota bacterium]
MLYENVFIFSGQLSQKSAEDKFEEFLNIIKDSGGKILKKESWGLRDLAYKIKKNSKGYYYMINCDCNYKVFKDFYVKVKQDVGFLRFLSIKIKKVEKEPSMLNPDKSD